jgi:MFS family permease
MCFLTGLSDAMYVVSKSIITDLVKNINQRALYFSYLGSSGTLGFIISPLLAFCLVNNDNPLKPNISLPFLVVSIGQLMAAGIFATTFSETEKKLLQFSPSYHSPIRQVREALAHPLLKVDYQLNLFVYLLYFLFMAYYPIYLTNHYNLSIQGLSYYLILATLVSYCSGVFISKVLFRHFTISTLLFRLLMLISIACFLFTMALFIVGSTLTLAATVMLFSLALPCAMSILSQSSPDKEQGEVIARSYLLEMGAQSSMGFLAGALASLYLPLGLIIIALGALLMALNKHKFIKA